MGDSLLSTRVRMFSRRWRVRKRAEIVRLQSNGRKVRTDHFLCAYSSRDPVFGLAPYRLAVTITKKIEKRAARRNRLRRRIRELFRASREELGGGCVDLVVIALNGATELAFPEVKSEIILAFDRIARNRRGGRA